ncbi:MAG: hypothetical protein GTO29_08815 [Candidatus Latescibacteria bacterium]|nr:hypothetical protein [Candidatus Latescibacterota bacterium]NIO56264.1 hypothetical protein [Candidatus Latescibacterota bacterium]
MKKISIGRVILAGFVASLVFLFVEIVLEGSVQLIFGVSETELMREARMTLPSGTLYYVVTIVYLYMVCTLIMWVYAAIRPRFRSRLHAGLVTGMIFWLFVVLFLVNYSNIGLYPLKLGLLGMGFNLVEIPAAVIVGSLVYKE